MPDRDLDDLLAEMVAQIQTLESKVADLEKMEDRNLVDLGLIGNHWFEFIGCFKKAGGGWTPPMDHQNEPLRSYGIAWFQQFGTEGDGDSAETDILLEAGEYYFNVAGISQNNLGKLDWSMDGINFITGQDWYSLNTIENVNHYGTVILTTSGKHTIRMTINGKNVASAGYYWLLTAFALTMQFI